MLVSLYLFRQIHNTSIWPALHVHTRRLLDSNQAPRKAILTLNSPVDRLTVPLVVLVSTHEQRFLGMPKLLLSVADKLDTALRTIIKRNLFALLFLEHVLSVAQVLHLFYFNDVYFNVAYALF